MQNWRAGRNTTIDQAVEQLRDGEDPGSLRNRVVELLGKQTELYEPNGARSEPLQAADEEIPELPGYDVSDLLGRGGMGAVYEAYQQSTSRRVAVKFMLDRGGDRAGQCERFEREVDLCARLQHPNIVSIIDSGVHKGRLYYVMEYVEGERLDDFLTPGECDPRTLLRTIVKIGRAVDYAHQRGVLHRDLKPGNILVDDRGEPHLLDFGLAKAIDPTSGGGLQVSISEPGQLLGTIAYMAPEQSRGEFEQMSVRSDVYSLGAIAYELLTGKLPCDVDGPLPVVLRGIADLPPVRPSTLTKSSNNDVDAILLKALEKAPGDRYATASDLADDIERHLGSQTIHARRAGPVLRTLRWYRRNQIVATIGLAASVSLVIGGAVAYWNVTGQREQLNGLLEDDNFITESADFDRQKDEAIVDYFVQKAAFASRLDRLPRRQSDLLDSIGIAFRKLGEYERARAALTESLRLAEEHYPKRHPQRVKRHHDLASVLWWLGEYGEAEPHYLRAVEGWRDLYERGYRRLYGVHDPDMGKNLARSLDHLSSNYSRLFRMDEAIPTSREALDLRLAILGEDHMDVAQSYNNLARILNSTGRHEDVEELCDKGLVIIRARYGESHRGVASLLQQKGRALLETNQLDAALETLLASLAVKEAVLVRDHTSTANTLHDLALIRIRNGDYTNARSEAQRAFQIRLLKLPEVHEEIAESLLLEGRLHLIDGDLEVAESRVADAVVMYRQLWPGRRTWQLLEAESIRAEIEAERGNTDEARVMLAGISSELAELRPAPSRVWTETQARLARISALDSARSRLE